MRLYPLSVGPYMLHYFTVFQLDDLVPKMEIPIIMSDDDHRLPSRAQIRKQYLVKDLLVLRILICRPFIKDIDRTVLKVAVSSANRLRCP